VQAEENPDDTVVNPNDPGEGDEEAARSVVDIGLKNNGLTKSTVRKIHVPSFIAIELSIKVLDAETYNLVITGPDGKDRVVTYKHAMRNAMLPVVTNIGLEIPFLFTGAIVTETIFSWPGIGRLTIGATNGIIIKLPKQISVYLVDTIYPVLTNEIESIISELNTLLDTNLVISRTRNITGATIKIYLTDRNTYTVAEPQVVATLTLLNSNYIGLAHLNWNRNNGEIYNGSAFVDMIGTDISNQRRVIRHEIMHTLGLYGHVTMPEFNSVLFPIANVPFPTLYTFFDKNMIKLLYNPAITPGINEAELNAVLVNL